MIYVINRLEIAILTLISNIKENERCDELAVAAAGSKKLNKDVWYENNVANKNELF